MPRNKKQKIREITVAYTNTVIFLNDDFAETITALKCPKTNSAQDHKEFNNKVITLLQNFKTSGITRVKEQKETENRDIETLYDIDTYIANWQSA